MPALFETWLLWLEDTSTATAVRQSPWLYPFVQVIHITGIVVLVGSVLIFDLRLLGFAKRFSILDLGHYLIPLSKGGFVLVILSGFLLFIAHATDWAENPLFWLKIILIIVAVINAVTFNKYVMRKLRSWEINGKHPPLARLSGAFSIILWFLVITAGRYLAYY